MRANWAVMYVGLTALAGPAWAADTERKIDPTFLHRNTASAREVPSDITATGCHYKPLFGEGDATVAAKFAAALQAGLTPILCVGETQEQRDAGVTQITVESQLSTVIDHCGVAALGRAALAYEPLWAIGTGKVASPAQAEEVHADLRSLLAKQYNESVAAKVRILYGGSVKASNAAELFAMADVDGGLIGGASLKADEFLAILAAAG